MVRPGVFLLVASVLLAGCSTPPGQDTGGAERQPDDLAGPVSASGTSSGESLTSSDPLDQAQAGTSSTTETDPQGTASPSTSESSTATPEPSTSTSGSATSSSTSSTSPGTPSSSAPPLAAGAHWTHRDADSGVETHTMVEAAEERNGHPTYRIKAVTHASSGGASTTITQTTWVRTGDRAIVEETSRIQLTGPYPLDRSVTTAYPPPCPVLQWPLAAGASWQHTCTTTNGGTRTTNYTVEAQEQVATPAGTFDAYRIHAQSGSSSSLDWFSLAACWSVRTQSGSANDPTIRELVSYDC